MKETIIKKLYTYLHGFRKSIIFRIFFGIILVILPINIVMILGAHLFYNATKQQSFLEIEHALSLYMRQVDVQTENVTSFLINESSSVNYLRIVQPDTSTAKKQYDYVKAQVVFRNKLTEMLRNNSFMDGAFGHFGSEDIIIIQTNSGAGLNQIQGYIKEYIEKIRLHNEKAAIIYWQPIQIQNDYYLLYINKKLDSFYGAWIELDNLMGKLAIDDKEAGYINYFRDEEGNILSDMDVIINKDDTYSLVNEEEGITNTVYLPISGVSDSGLELVRLIPQNQFINSIPKVAKALQFFSVIFLIAIPIIIFIIKRQVMEPVNRLLAAIHHIDEGDIDYRIKEKNATNEFHEINASFNGMMDQIKKLKINVYENEIDKQRIKLEYLRHQVQPHFILNTLNIVYSYEKDEYDLTQQMIMNMIRYYRYIVRVNASFVPLHQELEHIKNYIEIQKVRYPNSFSAKIHCEESLENCLIPPLIIQNFVENAFKNALDLDQHFHLAIDVKPLDEDKVCITIADSGKGYSEQVLRDIRAFKRKKVKGSELGVGIQNTIERLELLYNNVPKIYFANQEVGGAIVKIIIPKHIIEVNEEDV